MRINEIMGWLITACLVCIISGLIFVFSGESLNKLSESWNRPVVNLDQAISLRKIPAGIALVAAGGWIISVAANYPETWYCLILGGTILAIGLVYLFGPEWLEQLSNSSDRIVFSGGELGLTTRIILGIILVLIGFYGFYAVFLVA